MTDAKYRVIQRDDDSFAVEVIRTGALPQTAAGIETQAQEKEWVTQDKSLTHAADPFRTRAYRRRRGF